MKRYIYGVFLGLLTVIQLIGATAQIQQLKGDVRVRRALEEKWSPAGVGMDLESMDTIFSGEASEVVLILNDGSCFVLGGNAVLDISDLDRITERQLFLYLMSQKVGRLNVPESSQKIHITNVSVVRGSQIPSDSLNWTLPQSRDWVLEFNGAKALYHAKYYTNAIMKYYKILERYPSINDGGEIHFLMGLSFEAIHENGRAYDAYQTALERIDPSPVSKQLKERKVRIQEALERVKAGF